MGFMLTPFFVNARTAGTAAGFLNFFLGLLYLIVALVPNIPVGAIWALNLFSPTGFAIAIGEVCLPSLNIFVLDLDHEDTTYFTIVDFLCFSFDVN